MALRETQQGITAPDRPANPERRAFLRRAGETAVAATGVAGLASVTHNLFLPHEARASVQRPESPAPLTQEARITQAKREIQEMRERGLWLPNTLEASETTKRLEPKRKQLEQRGRLMPETNGYIPPFSEGKFKPGQRIDRGPATKDDNGKYRVYVRADDFWWEQPGLDFVRKAKELGIDLLACPVEGAVTLYSQIILEIKRNKGTFANHGKLHGGEGQTQTWDKISYPEIANDLLPQQHALDNVLLINGRQLNEQLFIAPPYGAGAVPGYTDYNQNVYKAAKNSRSATLGWTIDNLVWQTGITEDQMFDILVANLVPGAITIWHPDVDGKSTRVLQRFAEYARSQNYEFHNLAELPHTPTVGA